MVVVVVVLEVPAWLLDDWQVGIQLLFLVPLAFHEQFHAFFDNLAAILHVLKVASGLPRVRPFPAAVP